MSKCCLWSIRPTSAKDNLWLDLWRYAEERCSGKIWTTSTLHSTANPNNILKVAPEGYDGLEISDDDCLVLYKIAATANRKLWCRIVNYHCECDVFKRNATNVCNGLPIVEVFNLHVPNQLQSSVFPNISFSSSVPCSDAGGSNIVTRTILETSPITFNPKRTKSEESTQNKTFRFRYCVNELCVMLYKINWLLVISTAEFRTINWLHRLLVGIMMAPRICS